MMDIVGHKLKGCWAGQSPNCGGALVEPSLLVMHFTASGGADPTGDVNWFLSAQAKAAAHIVIGRNGAVKQVVPFNVKAWHAGVSIWRGRRNCNDYSIGIEVDNWGRLVKAADGQMRSYTGGPVEPASAAFLQHKNETTPSYWEMYSQIQLDAVAEVTRAILGAYPSIKEIVGHEDIAPGRKVDPGPAFPMSRFVSLVGGRGNEEVVERAVTVASLNARGGGGTEFDVLGQFAEGAKVTVLYDSPGPWAQVKGTLSDGKVVTAWVADQYLR
jgi:N-acetylmuramoyl-L-alanine amidase